MLECSENIRKYDVQIRYPNVTSNAMESIGDERIKRQKRITNIW